MLIYLPCEEAQGIDRLYDIKCPIFCYPQFFTRDCCIDFSDQINVDTGLDFVNGDDVLINQTFIDSCNRTWRFSPPSATEILMGTYLTGVACGDIVNITNNLSGIGGSLSLVPDRLAPCFPNPVINFSYPWTIYLKVTVLDG
ncbi:unnamed protein product, partial [marine sediment metagenome]